MQWTGLYKQYSHWQVGEIYTSTSPSFHLSASLSANLSFTRSPSHSSSCPPPLPPTEVSNLHRTMRILETSTGQFVEIDPLKVEYAILSHTWSRAGEQSYQDVVRLHQWLARRKSSIFLSIYAEVSWRASLILSFLLHLLFIATTTGHLTGSFLLRVREPRNTRLARELERCVDWLRAVSSQCRPCETILEDRLLSTKIRMACAVARAHGHLLLWIDSCCIDKTSSSELSEAINSMYLWYRHASVCYAYLADVPSHASAIARDRAIRRSKWFTRGWTLQELIAPRIVVFLSSEWTFLGSRFGMADIVAQITAIDLEVLEPTHFISTASLSHRDPLLPLIRPGKRVGGQRSSTSFTFNSVGGEEVFVRVSLETRLRSPSEWLLDVEVLTGASAKALISMPGREGQEE